MLLFASLLLRVCSAYVGSRAHKHMISVQCYCYVQVRLRAFAFATTGVCVSLYAFACELTSMAFDH